MQSTALPLARALPASRRLLSTIPTGRPAATDRTTNLGAQMPTGYGGHQGPLPQATGGGRPPQPPSKSNVGVIVGAVALVGGAAAYYLTQESDPAGAVKEDLHKLEAGAKHEIDHLRTGARSSSAPLGPTAGAGAREVERGVDALRSPDNRYGAEQLKDALSTDAGGIKKEASRWGNALETSAQKEKNAFAGVKDEVKAWGSALTSGPSERQAFKPALEEVRRYRDILKGRGDYGVEEVEAYLHGAGLPSHNVTQGGNVWLDWIGGGRAVRRSSARQKLDQLERDAKSATSSAGASLEQKYYDTKASIQDAASDVRDDARGWLAWGERKGDKAAKEARSEYEQAKQKAEKEASSWSSWTQNKAADAKSAVSSAAQNVENSASSAYNSAAGATSSAYSSAANATSSAYTQAAGAAQGAEKKVEKEGKSWLNWGGEKAGDAKDGLKSGLLSAEKGVERGAQKAQDETKKL
ncbi:hypothetical protein JCM11641_003274 [Rhodosporidiobolus odoratus]